MKDKEMIEEFKELLGLKPISKKTLRSLEEGKFRNPFTGLWDNSTSSDEIHNKAIIEINKIPDNVDKP